MICLSSTRFSMRATLVNPNTLYEDPANPDYSFEGSQDPYTGKISVGHKVKVDNPETTTVNEGSKQFRCLARGVISNGIRSVGNTEHFGDVYENLEYVQLWFPSFVVIKKDDRITNIRDSSGKIVYLDEEYRKNSVPTVFNVDGVTQVFDAFNKNIENFALLSKVQ